MQTRTRTGADARARETVVVDTIVPREPANVEVVLLKPALVCYPDNARKAAKGDVVAVSAEQAAILVHRGFARRARVNEAGR